MRTKSVSLLHTLSLVVSGLTVFVCVTFGILLYAAYYHFADQELKNSLTQTATELSSQYFVIDNHQIKYRDNKDISITDLLKSRDLSAVIVDSEYRRIGTFGIFRTAVDQDALLDQKMIQTISSAQQKQSGVFEHISILDTTYEMYTLPLTSSGETIGYVQLAKRYASLEKMQSMSVTILLMILFPTVLVLWFIIHMILKKFFTPVENIVHLVSSISVDSMPHKLPVHSSFVEISSLIHSCNTMIERLEQGIERQKHFTAYESHEINTPLTRALSNLEIVQHHLQYHDKEASQTIEESITELEKVSSLLEGLVLLLRPPQHETQYNTNILETLYSVVNNDLKLGKKAITINTNILDTTMVNIHPAHLYMLIKNILVNAVKYSKESGEITIELGKNNMLSISDMGIGIDEHEQQEVFAPFFRTQAATHQKGIGVGLSLVKQICLYYHMKITLKSQPYKGTTIYIHDLPVIEK